MSHKVYSVDAGGSTMDILAVFSTKALAEELVTAWRDVMDIHDDGWGIQELEVRDTLPNYATVYSASLIYTYPGFYYKSGLQRHRWDGRVTEREKVNIPAGWKLLRDNRI